MWVLIIVLHGWGAGIGSTGNAVSMTEFTSKEKCELAAKVVKQADAKTTAYHSAESIQILCVEK